MREEPFAGEGFLDGLRGRGRLDDALVSVGTTACT
jgi:hypothetical protein